MRGRERRREEEAGRFRHSHSRFASAVEVVIMESSPPACPVSSEQVRAVWAGVSA